MCLSSFLGWGRRCARWYCEVTKLLEGICPRQYSIIDIAFLPQGLVEWNPFALGGAQVDGWLSGPVSHT